MKKMLLYAMVLSVLLSGCSDIAMGGESQERVTVEGKIGDDASVSRDLVARMIALAFYTNEEMKGLDKIASFQDVDTNGWAYPYINGAVTLKLLSGDENGFRPKDALSLWEAQMMLDRLAPEYENKIVLTDENRNMAVSYGLWTQLFETALEEKRQAEDLKSYGIVEKEGVVLQTGESGDTDSGKTLLDTGYLETLGYDLTPYQYRKIRYWQKGNALVGLLEVTAVSPTIYNIYNRKDGNQLVLVTGDGEVKLPVADTIFDSFQEGICNLTLEDGVVVGKECGMVIQQPIIRRVSETEVYLDGYGAVPWADGFRVYQQDFSKGSWKDLIVGTNLADFYVYNGKLLGAVIKEDVLPTMIRVTLRGAKPQSEVTIKGEGLTIGDGARTETIGADGLQITADSPWLEKGLATVTGDIITLVFSDGTEAKYQGEIEIQKTPEGLYLINVLDMEDYLEGVVSHEMSANFGAPALQAQAISSRGYAVSQFYTNSYAPFGGHVTDTVESQVFSVEGINPESQAAVAATRGEVMTFEDKVAQTYFYSTSSGFGSSAGEVWSEDGSFADAGKPYLVSQSFSQVESTPQTEEEWLAFYQNWEMEGLDMDSPWYRWKVYFGAGQLAEIVEETIRTEAEKNPNNIQVQQEDGTWKVGMLETFGRLNSIVAVQRGEGGLVQILELQFENGGVRVLTEGAVRRVLSPTKRTIGDDIYLQHIKGEGDSITGMKNLPSAYFAIQEMKNAEGVLTGVALYGGGYGHGVGMSQYGAKYLGEDGKTAKNILEQYFPGTIIEKLYD